MTVESDIKETFTVTKPTNDGPVSFTKEMIDEFMEREKQRDGSLQRTMFVSKDLFEVLVKYERDNR